MAGQNISWENLQHVVAVAQLLCELDFFCISTLNMHQHFKGYAHSKLKFRHHPLTLVLMRNQRKFCIGGNIFGASRLNPDKAFSSTTEVDGDLY